MEAVDNEVAMSGQGTPQPPGAEPNGYTESAVFEIDDSYEGISTSSSDSGVVDQDNLVFVGNAVGKPSRKGLLPTGCCYDDRMKLHINVDWSPHPHHPEDPRRVEEIFNAFRANGLVYTGTADNLAKTLRDFPTRFMWRIAAREATEEEICIVHNPAHFSWVAALANKSYEELRELTKTMDQGRTSLYVGSMSYSAALLSAGGAIETCKQVVEGNVKNAFAVIRPPGHHAEYDQPMGFCFFNNVPIAVKVCQQDYPDTCRKVLILDWDVHHGNGVQNIFYEDPNVLYISLHVYQNGIFYPGKPDNPMIPDGGIEYCGTGPGLGRNVNIGWHDQGMGDGEYMAAFQKIVMPIAEEFNPDLVVVSAGFDAADGDELGGCFVSPTCYAHMTHMLMSLADGKVCVCLEGGYNLKAISDSAVAVARTLMGEPPPKMEIPKINKEAARIIARVQAYQAPYWECMRQGIVNISDVANLNSSRLHDVVRSSQRQNLSSTHHMVPLYIQRDGLVKTFENQVLVTPRISECRRLLVLLHDPPHLLGQPDLLDNTIQSHNAWVVDEVAQYIDWAVRYKFGVMDINVPAHSMQGDEEEYDSFAPRASERTIERQVQELICYLWDNYIQLYEYADEIFFMGVGSACIGVKSLLTCRESKDRISGVVNFVTGTLKAVKSDVDIDLSSWYKENSRVYVGSDHACWSDPELTRKVSKRRFGTVIKSPMPGLNKMLHEHAKEAQAWILSRMPEHGDTTEEEKMA